jgi:hypothetical protein
MDYPKKKHYKNLSDIKKLLFNHESVDFYIDEHNDVHDREYHDCKINTQYLPKYARYEIKIMYEHLSCLYYMKCKENEELKKELESLKLKNNVYESKLQNINIISDNNSKKRKYENI